MEEEKWDIRFCGAIDRYRVRVQPDLTVYGAIMIPAGDDILSAVAATVESGDIGFRFYSQLKGVAHYGDGLSVNFKSDPFDHSREYWVGRYVSRDYVEWVRQGGDPSSEGMGDVAYVQLLVAYDAAPGAPRIVEWVARDGRRICYVLTSPSAFVLLDSEGNEVIADVGPPDGWEPPTEFPGKEFSVEVRDNVVSVRVYSDGNSESAGVGLSLGASGCRDVGAAILSAMRRTCDAAHGAESTDPTRGFCPKCSREVTGTPGFVDVTGVTGNPSDKWLRLATGAQATVPIAAGRALQLGYDGTKLRVVLSTQA